MYLSKVSLPEGFEDRYPFKNGETVLVIGEIEQMPGHVAVVIEGGRVFYGYHESHFIKRTNGED